MVALAIRECPGRGLLEKLDAIDDGLEWQDCAYDGEEAA